MNHFVPLCRTFEVESGWWKLPCCFECKQLRVTPYPRIDHQSVALRARKELEAMSEELEAMDVVPTREEVEALLKWLDHFSHALMHNSGTASYEMSRKEMGHIAEKALDVHTAILTLSRKLEEVTKNADAVCDSYAEENQRLSDERNEAYAKGAEEMREAAARVVEQYSHVHPEEGYSRPFLHPRVLGDKAGLPYATAIRALSILQDA